MNGFTKKSIGTLTLGEKLRKLRSERRISLNEVAKSTKIQLKYLEYLEAGQYEKLPVDVYVKGFLKNYAEFLGVDENILIRLFEKEKGIRHNLEKGRENGNKKPEPLKISSFVITPKLIAVTSLLLLAFGGFFYLYREVGSFANEPRLVVLSPEANAMISGNSVTVEGVTDKDSRVYINNQATLVNDDGKFRENLTLQSGNNSINVRAVNRFDKEVSQTLIVQSDYQKEEIPAAPSAEQLTELEKPGVDLEVRVDAEAVKVSVEVDGVLVFNGAMTRGATQSFHGTEKISIDSSRANATFVKVNKKDSIPLGPKAAAIKGVVFTAETVNN